MVKSNFKKELKQYLHSFKLKSRFLYTFIIDGLYWLIIYLIFNLLHKYFSQKAESFGGGRTAAQLKQYLVTATPEQAQTILVEMKAYFFTLIISVALFIILAFLVFSLSRALIWHLLHKKKFSFKKHFKWNLLNFILLIFTIPMFLLVIIINFIINFVIRPSVNTGLILTGIVQLVIFLAFIYLVFLIYSNFTQKHQIWSSIGSAFETITKKFKKTAFSYIFTFITFGILTVILTALTPHLSFITNLSFIVYLLALAWLRIYITKTTT